MLSVHEQFFVKTVVYRFYGFVCHSLVALIRVEYQICFACYFIVVFLSVVVYVFFGDA